MGYIATRLREQVRIRAKNRCEYCGLSQVGQAASFHIDHVIPRASNGATIPENLALACVTCSLFKSAREMVLDPETGVVVPLFNPRNFSWKMHFRWDQEKVIGISPTGRATVIALRMNRPIMLSIRRE